MESLSASKRAMAKWIVVRFTRLPGDEAIRHRIGNWADDLARELHGHPGAFPDWDFDRIKEEYRIAVVHARDVKPVSNIVEQTLAAEGLIGAASIQLT